MTDTDFLVQEIVLRINHGIAVTDSNFSELIMMTVTVTDPDLNLLELDWKSYRNKRYFFAEIWGSGGRWNTPRREWLFLDPEVLQSGFGLSFLVWSGEFLGESPTTFSGNSSLNLFPWIFGPCFSRGFRSPPKVTPKIHAQNCRHSSNPLGPDFWIYFFDFLLNGGDRTSRHVNEESQAISRQGRRQSLSMLLLWDTDVYTPLVLEGAALWQFSFFAITGVMVHNQGPETARRQ